MTRWTSFAIVGLLCGTAWGDDKADRAVDAVLSLEAREGIANRADQLSGVMDAPRARWATGYINEADGWHPFDTTAARLGDDPNWQEYKRRRGTQTLTLQQHLEIADWCAAHGLKDQQRAHLWGALILNPKQPAVWQKLGYHEVNGEWLTVQDEQSHKLKQKKTERDYRAWLARAQSLQQRLSDPSPGTQGAARDQLMAIKNVAALPSLEAVLSPASEEVAIDFVKWAGGINRAETTMALARQAVMSPWERVRDAAIEGLRTRRIDHYAPVLLSTLEMPSETSVTLGADPRQSFQPFVVVHSRRELRDRIYENTYREDMTRIPVYEMDIDIAKRTKMTNSVNVRQIGFTASLARDINDFTRNADQSAQSLRSKQAAADEIQAAWNDRVAMVLTLASDAPPQTNAKQWWDWWASFAAIDDSSEYDKPIESSSQYYVRPTTPIIIVSMHFSVPGPHSCLPAGTPIVTESGPKPIETIRIGDRVLSKDIVTGELAYRPVLQTTVRKPQPLKRLHLENETISATLGHYFWVSGQGWRMTKELKPGDRLHGVNGTVELTSVTTGEVAAVYNLVVERANTYFVGNSHILSHDVTPPSPTNIVVPGLAVR